MAFRFIRMKLGFLEVGIDTGISFSYWVKWSTGKLREFTLKILNREGDQTLFEIKIERSIEKR